MENITIKNKNMWWNNDTDEARTTEARYKSYKTSLLCCVQKTIKYI